MVMMTGFIIVVTVMVFVFIEMAAMMLVGVMVVTGKAHGRNCYSKSYNKRQE